MQKIMPAKPTEAASMHTPLLLVPQVPPAVGHEGGNAAAGSVVQNFTPPSGEALHISPAAQPLAAGGALAPPAAAAIAPAAPTTAGMPAAPTAGALMPAIGAPLLAAVPAAPAAGEPARAIATGGVIDVLPAALGAGEIVGEPAAPVEAAQPPHVPMTPSAPQIATP
jgi:hypothetical protein